MKNSPKKRNEKRIKFFVAAAAVAVAVISLIIILISFFSNIKSINNKILVYKNDNGYVIRISNLETVITDPSASDFKCDTENNRVFYTVSSSYSDGMSDLYYVEKNRSELSKPKIIDYGIYNEYIFCSGKIFYLKNNPQIDADDAYCCDFKDSTIKSFSSNVESIYPINNSETVYFIKLHGSERVLYRYSGEKPVEVSRNIADVHLFNDSDVSQIFYEVYSKIYSGMTELYCADSDGAPELICDNTFKVLYDEYNSGGNLYYFTSSKENISWSYVIADAYAETDKEITRPKRENFLSILGISVEYNQKLREYQDKLVRDEIRDALNESVENGEFSAPVYTAFAYNSKGSHKIAENINPQNIYAVNSFGTPEIIFESCDVVSSDTDMETLVEIAQRSSISEVIEYARSVINDSVKSTGIKIVGCNNNSVFEYALEGYDLNNTSFVFSKDGSRIYALVRDVAGERLKLFSCSLDSDYKPTQKININNGISSYYFIENSVIYLKSDIGKNTGDVYCFSDDENVKISNAANALKVDNENSVIVLKGYDGSSTVATADYYAVDGSNELIIAESIIVNSFTVDENGDAAFISSANGEDTLYIYSDGKNKLISAAVSDILLFS